MPNEWTPPTNAVKSEPSEVNNKGDQKWTPPTDIVKKKDETLELPSVEEIESISSDTEAPKSQGLRLSVSSGLEGQTFSGYPGKEDNEYRVVDGKWQKRKKKPKSKPNLVSMITSPFTGGEKDEYTSWRDVTNEGSINALNNQFDPITPEEQARDFDSFDPVQKAIQRDRETSQMGQFTGLVPVRDFSSQKEQAISNVEGLTKARDLQLQAAKEGGATQEQIQNIETQFNDQIQFEMDNVQTIEANEQLNRRQALESMQNFRMSEQEKQLKQEITPKVIAKEEEQVVPWMSNKYGDLGFEFEETGFGDEMKVTSYRGNTINIDLDNFSSASDTEEAKRLRQFILHNQTSQDYRDRMNSMTADEFKSALLDEYSNDPTLFSEDDSNMFENIMQDQLHGMEMAGEEIRQGESAVSKQIEEINSELDENGGQMTDEIARKYNDVQRDLRQIEAKKESLKSEAENIDTLQSKINAAAGAAAIKRYKQDEKRGSFWGGAWNSFLSGFETQAEAQASIAANILPSLLPDAGMNPLEYETLKGQGLTDDEILDIAKKGIINNLMPGVESGLTDLFGSETTDAYINSEDRGDFDKAIFGVAETIPALASAGKSKAASFAALAAMSYAHVESEMRNNPEFENISESEKKLVSVPYAMVMGALENIGFTKLLGKNPAAKSLANSVLKKVFRTAPKNATLDQIEGMIERDVAQRLRSGAIKIVGGAIVEGETGALQESADIGIKEIYNIVKEKKMFDTPDSLKEAVDQVVQGAKLEAIGGIVMSGAQSTAQIAARGMRGSGVSDQDIEAIMGMADNPEFRNAYQADLKVKVTTGNITKEQAEEALNKYDKVMSNASKIPTDTSGPRKAYDLITEKQELEEKMMGKDPSLVSADKDRVLEIDEELKQMSTQKKAGSRLFSEPNAETKEIAKKYKEEKGIDTPEGENITELDENQSMEIADAYEVMEDNPDSPEVQEAYAAMADETLDQYQAMIDAGYEIELYEGDGEPYANSEEMLKDLRENKHMYVFATESGFGESEITDADRQKNKMLQDSGYTDKNGKKLLINDIFRGVHDFFGHSERGNSFGPKGEENAWDVHARMYSPKARRAMTTETRGQNSWVNFGPQMRNDQGNLIRKGEEGYLPLSQRQFAPQKMGLLPEKYSQIIGEESTTEGASTETFESAFTRGTESASKWLEDVESKLDQFGKETLGVNVPVALAKSAIKVAKATVNTANSVSEVIDAAINHVRESDWFKSLSADDQAKAEQKVQRLFTDPGKEIKAPSAQKITNQPKQKKVTLTERAALRSQIMMEARAAKEGAKSEREVRKGIQQMISKSLIENRANIKPRQFRSIVNRALKMNLSNPVMADRFIDYVNKSLRTAEYDKKISDSFSNRRKLSRLSRQKNLQPEVKSILKQFSSIDPRNVEDIDQHLEITDALSKMARPTRNTSQGVSIKDFGPFGPISEYIETQLERQESIEKDMMEIKFPELFEQGILNRDMSLGDMRNIVSSINEEGGSAVNFDDESRARLESTYDLFLGAINEMYKSGIDPISGEKIEVTPTQKKAAKMMNDLDVDSLSLKELMEVVDMAGNLMTNGMFSNIEGTLSYFEGRKNASDFLSKNGKAKRMNKFLRGYTYHLTSLPVLIDTMMTGVRRGNEFMRDSGLSQLVRESNVAQVKASKILDSYLSKFKKSKPNGQNFNSSFNTYERGIVAFLSRNLVGSEMEMTQEYNRRLRIIQETMDYLDSERASGSEKKKGKVYREVYDKMGLSGSSYDTFKENAAKENIEAVDWWISKWDENYDGLRDVSLSIYNKDLPRDINYTPDRYKRKDSADTADVEEVMNGAFGSFNDSAYNKESGVLMSANRPQILPKNRVIDLDFDSNNYAMIEAALVDMETAGSIRKVAGFTDSESYKDMFEPEDANSLKQRINNYILRTRRKEFVREDQTKMLKQFTNLMAKLGTSRALGGFDQIPKQTISVMMNTILNSNGRSGLVDVMKSDAAEWIDRSGMPISRRGIEAETTIEAADRRLDKAGMTRQKVMSILGSINDFYLKKFLSNPDKYVARASFIAYYKQNLRERGLSQDIDFSGEMDQEAADYAQHMVDRQQNISDSNLAGEFFLNRSVYADIVRKVFFPFANFVMNQKSRMYSDIRSLTSKDTTSQDRATAAKSLAGLAVEMMAFRAIAITLNSAYKGAAHMITGHEPEEEDYKINQLVKRENKLREAQGSEVMTKEEEAKFRSESYADQLSEKNFKSFWTQVVKDVFSPIPPADEKIVSTFNSIAGEADMAYSKNSSEMDRMVDEENILRQSDGKEVMTPEEENEFRTRKAEEEMFQLWDFEDSGYGTLGIAQDKYEEYEKTAEAAEDGTVTIKSQRGERKKYLTPEDQEIAKFNRWGMMLYMTGLLPSDIGKEARYIQKSLEKSALTENQMDKYNALKEEQGYVTDDQLKMIKKGEEVKAESN